MRIAIIGMGRMGLGLAGRLLEAGHQVVGIDLDENAKKEGSRLGAQMVGDMKTAVELLSPPRISWAMLPAGESTEKVLAGLLSDLAEGDLVVDGGNSDFRDSKRRAELFSDQGIGFVDCGVSGGLEGAERGYCLMAGGEAQAIEKIKPVFEALAAPEGAWAHVGPCGSGHFAKMVHNGIEYGMMQSIAEGVELLASEDGLSMAAALDVWRRGSIVRSRLMDLASEAVQKDPTLSGFAGVVGQKGEGRWASEIASQRGLPVPALDAALKVRELSAQRRGLAEKLLSALRQGFGGHQEEK